MSEKTVDEIREEVERLHNNLQVAYEQALKQGLTAFMYGFSARRDTCKDILDFIDGKDEK